MNARESTHAANALEYEIIEELSSLEVLTDGTIHEQDERHTEKRRVRNEMNA